MSASLIDSIIISIFFFKQMTAYEMRISDWSSDVCSSDLNVIKAVTILPTLLPQPLVGNLRVGNHSCHLEQFGKWHLARTKQTRVERCNTRSLMRGRSEERGVGKECVSKSRARWSSCQ